MASVRASLTCASESSSSSSATPSFFASRSASSVSSRTRNSASSRRCISSSVMSPPFSVHDRKLYGLFSLSSMSRRCLDQTFDSTHIIGGLHKEIRMILSLRREGIARLSEFVRDLAQAGALTQEAYRRWRKDPRNAKRMAEYFDYTNLEGV